MTHLLLRRVLPDLGIMKYARMLKQHLLWAVIKEFPDLDEAEDVHDSLQNVIHSLNCQVGTMRFELNYLSASSAALLLKYLASTLATGVCPSMYMLYNDSRDILSFPLFILIDDLSPNTSIQMSWSLIYCAYSAFS